MPASPSVADLVALAREKDIDAIRTLRQQNAHRAAGKTWAAFCRDVLDMSASYVARLLKREPKREPELANVNQSEPEREPEPQSVNQPQLDATHAWYTVPASLQAKMWAINPSQHWWLNRLEWDVRRLTRPPAAKVQPYSRSQQVD